MCIKWDDFVSNEEVLRRSKPVDVEVILAQNRLRWLGHIARMENSRTVKNSSLVSLSWAVDRLGVHAKDMFLHIVFLFYEGFLI